MRRPLLLLALCMALALALATPAMAQTTQPITEEGTGTQELTSQPGCQNGGECTSELEGSVAGDPITNPDAVEPGAGITATLTADYSQVEQGPTPGTFSVPTTGTATLTDADGSTLSLDVQGTYTGSTAGTGPMTFAGTFTITGGTGRFAGASGSGDLTATSQGGTFTAQLDGELILPDPEPNPDLRQIQCSKPECFGTNKPENIKERRGDGKQDDIHARGGADLVDASRFTNDRDVLRGQGGSDRLLSDDGDGRDVILCGAGNDVAVIDPGDTVTDNCEDVRGDATPTVVSDQKAAQLAE